MAQIATSPFAALLEPGLIMRAVADSLQLKQLPTRQYSPLSEPSRVGSQEGPDIDDCAQEMSDADRDVGHAVTDSTVVSGSPLRGCWLGGVAETDRFDFVDTTDHDSLTAVDPVARVG